MNYIPLLQDRLNKVNVIRKCDDCELYETDNEFYFVRTDTTINSYHDGLDTYINILYVILLDLGCDKKFKLADVLTGNIIGGSYPLGNIEFNFMNTGKTCFIHDFGSGKRTDYSLMLFIASTLGYPHIYQKLLDMYGNKLGMDNLKTILKEGGIYINNNECRDILMRYINTHFNEEEIGL